MRHDLITAPGAETSTEREGEQGFTLIELLISLVLFLIVTGTIYGLMQVARQSRWVTNQQVQLNKGVRVALNLVGRDTLNAGFSYPTANAVVLPDNKITSLLKVPNDFDTSRDTVPPIIAGNDLNIANSDTKTGTDQVTFLYKDSSFNLDNGVSQPLRIESSETVNGIDQILPVTGSNAACRINDILIVTGNTGSTLGLVTGLNGTNKVQFASGDVLGFNQPGSGNSLRSITMPAAMQRVVLVTYFVKTDGSLIRREYGNVPPTGGNAPQAWVDEPLVFGVEDFQIKYVMDDGSLADNPSAGVDKIPGTADDEAANLFKVRQVRFTVTVKSSEVDQKGQPIRDTMTTTYSTRNLGYDAS